MPAAPEPKSSRRRYRAFVDAYRQGRLDETEQTPSSVTGTSPDGPVPSASEVATVRGALRLLRAFFFPRGKRRDQLRAYAAFLWPHRLDASFVFLLALVTAGLEMVEPLFMRFIVDDVVLANAPAAERFARLHLAGGLFVAVVVLSRLTSVLKDYRQRLLNTRVMLALRRGLFDRLLHLPLATLWDMKTGGILSRVTGDVDTTTGLLQLAIVSPSISLVRLLVAVVVLVSLNWQLALTALGIIPGIMAISFIAARRVRPIYRSLRKDVERIDGRVGETFTGIRVVRAFRREALELLEFLRGRHTVLRKELFAQRREMVLWTSWGMLLGAVNVVIVWYGGYLSLQGRASVGDIMAFQWYTFLLLNPVWSIVNSFSELQRSLAAMERVFDVLAMPEDKADAPNAVGAPRRVEEIRFEHVTFEYTPGRPVVQDFDVVVPGGSVVALVGRSGAGKTTVTDLVARFHDPTTGRIVLNGRDVRDMALKSYRSLLGIVQQDVFLFDGSVRDNIAYGRPTATEAEVEDAARRANAHEFIAALPGGYETFVGERGVKLSGGQQQRLAIARAILASPQILILDEATSNLDTESEQLIQASLATLLAGRTTFVIAHRLSTIRRAHIILLMEGGRVVEQGTHECLMDLRGRYHEMVQRQTASQDAAPLLS